MAKQPDNCEVLLINKPYTWTSFDVVNKVRNLLKHKVGCVLKVGHAGTLDPLATGLLIICTGRFTKRIDEFQGQEKEYTGTFCLGATTPSYDLETTVDKKFPIDHITDEMVIAESKKFIGTYYQLPPFFSAKKVDGVRSYEKARAGIQVDLRPTEITVKEFEIVKIDLPDIEFRIVCGKGTYIRALARDFGQALDSGAHLSKLCRTRIGEYKLDDAVDMDEYEFSINQSIEVANALKSENSAN